MAAARGLWRAASSVATATGVLLLLAVLLTGEFRQSWCRILYITCALDAYYDIVHGHLSIQLLPCSALVASMILKLWLPARAFLSRILKRHGRLFTHSCAIHNASKEHFFRTNFTSPQVLPPKLWSVVAFAGAILDYAVVAFAGIFVNYLAGVYLPRLIISRCWWLWVMADTQLGHLIPISKCSTAQVIRRQNRINTHQL
jgi:hypothetical protein